MSPPENQTLSPRLLAERIDHLREIAGIHTAHQREVFDLTQKYNEKALQLQASEYERRLELLNHEHAHIVESNSLHVSRQLFDQVVGGLHKADDISSEFRSEIRGRMKGIYITFTVIVAILSVWLAFISAHAGR